MADSPVLYVYYRPDNDDSYPGVPNRHITEADWARFSLSQRRTVENATTQEGYTRRKVWVHRDLVDETEQERADREAAEQAARDAYERGQSIVRWRDFEPLVPGPGEVIVGSEDGPVAVPADGIGSGGGAILIPEDTFTLYDRFVDADGTSITDHVSDIGTSWVMDTTGSIVVQGRSITSGGAGIPVAIQPSAGKDVRITARLVVSGTSGIGIVFRRVDNANYWYVWIEGSTRQLRVYSVIAGTSKMERFTAVPSLPYNEVVTLDIDVFGNAIGIDLRGHLRAQWYMDAEMTGTGVGVRIGGGATGGNKVDALWVRPLPAPSRPTLPTISATNAPSPLVLPEMYGDTQGTHPDVLDFGASGWNGYRYWMVWTPHTNSNTINENPSLAVSNDGTTWQHAPGITNPIVPTPGVNGSYNSDPDMVYDNGALYLFYRRTGYPVAGKENLLCMESQDGQIWSTPVEITWDRSMVSPSVVKRGDTWHMWALNNKTGPYSIWHYTASSPYGPWSGGDLCFLTNLTSLNGIQPWHLEVIDRKSRYDIIISSGDRSIPGSGMDGNLYFGSSFDGIHWEIAPTPFLTNTADGTSWDDGKLYRASALPTPTGYDMYYSAYSTNGKWYVGRTQVTVTP